MLQFSPGEYIPIVRQLEDPTDSTTRYVRAYVYKYKGSGAGTLLATLDLTDKTGQRFECLYQTPQDSDPYNLNIIIKVFDDSGYITESNRYERSHQNYLVAERWGMMYRSGGGADINYDKVKRIIKEEVEKIPKPVQKETDFSPLLKALDEVNRSIKSIKIPEMPEIPKPERVDFGPLVNAIERVQNEVRSIDIPETDLSPILKEMKKAITDFLGVTQEIIKYNREELVKKFEDFKKELKNSTFSMAFPNGEAKLNTGEKEPVKKRRLFL